MCNPAVVMIAGSLIQAYGTDQEGKAQSKQMRYQADISKSNAAFVGQEAGIIAEQGQVERQNVDLRADILRGQGLSGIAESGFEVGSGSALTWDIELAEAAARDKQTIQYQTDLDVEQKRQEQKNYLAEANMLRRGAGNIKSSASLSATGQVVGGSARALK